MADTDPFAVDLDRLRRRRTVKWSLYGPDVLAAWVAEMDFDVAPVVRAALHEAVDRDDLGYVPGDLSELTTATSQVLADLHGWEVPPTRVFPVADVLAGVGAALDVDLPPGCGVVLPTPAYPPLFEVVELSGRTVVPVPLADDGGRSVLDLDGVDAALAAGARGVLLCNPHNPTGRAFDADELVALAEVVERRGARVLADEVHAPLVLGGARHAPYAASCPAAAGHATTVTSASKAFNLAGLKCAQVVTTNHDDATRWRRLPVFAVPGPTPLGIAATVAAYRDGDAWRRELVHRLDANHRLLDELLRDELPGVRFRPPEATYLAWLDCAALGLPDPAAHFLHRGGVAVSDGPPFGAGAEQHVRLNVATSPDLLRRIVGRMGASLDGTEPAGDGGSAAPR